MMDTQNNKLVVSKMSLLLLFANSSVKRERDRLLLAKINIHHLRLLREFRMQISIYEWRILCNNISPATLKIASVVGYMVNLRGSSRHGAIKATVRGIYGRDFLFFVSSFIIALSVPLAKCGSTSECLSIPEYLPMQQVIPLPLSVEHMFHMLSFTCL